MNARQRTLPPSPLLIATASSFSYPLPPPLSFPHILGLFFPPEREKKRLEEKEGLHVQCTAYRLRQSMPFSSSSSSATQRSGKRALPRSLSLFPIFDYYSRPAEGERTQQWTKRKQGSGAAFTTFFKKNILIVKQKAYQQAAILAGAPPSACRGRSGGRRTRRPRRRRPRPRPRRRRPRREKRDSASRLAPGGKYKYRQSSLLLFIGEYLIVVRVPVPSRRRGLLLVEAALDLD